LQSEIAQSSLFNTAEWDKVWNSHAFCKWGAEAQNALGQNGDISVTIFHRNFLFVGKAKQTYTNTQKKNCCSSQGSAWRTLQWKEQLFHSWSTNSNSGFLYRSVLGAEFKSFIPAMSSHFSLLTLHSYT